MPLKSSYKIAEISGIPINLHLTFILFFLVVLLFQDFLTAFYFFLLFGTVLLHELAHSLVAQRYNIRIDEITLLPIGGYAAVDLPEDPHKEWRVALAGPLFNLVFAFALYMTLSSFYPDVGNILIFGSENVINLVGLFTLPGMMVALIDINIMLGLFNLVFPAFPMDGGRVMRALLSGWIGYWNATKFSVLVGKIFTFALFTYTFLAPDMGYGNRLLLIIMSVFIYGAGQGELEKTYMGNILRGLAVRDLMIRKVPKVDAGLSIEKLATKMMKEEQTEYFVRDGGKLVGYVSTMNVMRIPGNKHSEIGIEDIMLRDIPLLSEDKSISALFNILNRTEADILPVVRNNKVIGVLRKQDVLKAARLRELKSGIKL